MGFGEEEIEKFRLAGRIAGEVRELVESRIRVGGSLLGVAEFIEEEIMKRGADGFAFPVNISVNEVAAHYTPVVGDGSVFESGDLVKVDFGAHVSGFPSDTAFSVSLGDEAGGVLVGVVEEALSLAVGLCRPGVSVGEIGARVQELVESRGFRTVSNLTGHSLARWNLHSGVSVPNVSVPDGYVLREGDVFAIEPFVSSGKGLVHSSSPSDIFRFLSEGGVRLPRARDLSSFVRENFRTFPFCSRWVPEESRGLLSYLVKKKVLHQYPILKDEVGCKVSQAEHTVLVGEEPEVLTL